MTRQRRKVSKVDVGLTSGRRPQTLFRDWKGRFVSPMRRYEEDVVALVQSWRGYGKHGKYVDVIQYTGVTPEKMARLLTRDEYERLPEVPVSFKEFKPKGKYQAWNIAEQIDRAKGVRRKDLKVTMELQDGKRLRKVSFYTKIKANQKRSYQIFTAMNQAIGAERLHLYKAVGGKILADRKGRRVSIRKVTVAEVIV